MITNLLFELLVEFANAFEVDVVTEGKDLSVSDWIEWAIRCALMDVDNAYADQADVTYHVPEGAFQHAILKHQWRRQVDSDAIDVEDAFFDFVGGGEIRVMDHDGTELNFPEDVE